MTKKPVFMIGTGDRPVITFITETECAGSATREKRQTSVELLHESFRSEYPAAKVLEISNYSAEPLARMLTDEKLTLTAAGGETLSLRDALKAAEPEYPEKKEEPKKPQKPQNKPKDAKKQKAAAQPVAYSFEGRRIPARPPRLFYTWLFIRALIEHKELIADLLHYDAFTEYSYASTRRLNTPAFSAAAAVWLVRNALLEKAAADPDLLASLLVNGLPRPESKVRRITTEWMPKTAADPENPGNPIPED